MPLSPIKSFSQFKEEKLVGDHVNKFLDYACKELQINEVPQIELINDKNKAIENASFGAYSPGEKKIYLNIAGRHVADVLRTLAHEMVHHRQNLDGILHNNAGETGSDFENEANSLAGIMMRNYGRSNRTIYEGYENN
jgi:Zn-dependent peptidase ImmA (M78 family)